MGWWNVRHGSAPCLLARALLGELLGLRRLLRREARALVKQVFASVDELRLQLLEAVRGADLLVARGVDLPLDGGELLVERHLLLALLQLLVQQLVAVALRLE